VVQIIHGNLSEQTVERLNGTEAIAHTNGAEYERIYRGNCENEIKDRHEIIFDIMSNFSNTFYIDRDIVLKSWPLFDSENNRPYFARHSSGVGDEMLCYNGENIKFFKKMLQQIKERNLFNNLWGFRKILRIKKVNFIDDSVFDNQFTFDRDIDLLKSIGINWRH